MQNEARKPVPLPRTKFPLAPARNDASIYSNTSSSSEVFDGINFESPLPRDEPPPPYLLYDQPQSSAGPNQELSQLPNPYESVFPLKVKNGNRLSSSSALSVPNSLYENSEELLLRNRSPEVASRPNQSVILQFDPLVSNAAFLQQEQLSNRLLLEKFLQDDLYGELSNANISEDWTGSESDFGPNIPEPPVRFDSLPDHSADAKGKEAKAPAAQPQENKVFGWMKVLKRVSDSAKNLKISSPKDRPMDRPGIKGLDDEAHYRGALLKMHFGPVEELFGDVGARFCVLAGKQLVFYADNSCETVKEAFPLANILSIQLLDDETHKVENEVIHCFELSVSGKSRGRLIYGAIRRSERLLWLQHIGEALTNRFPLNALAESSRLGWCYLKEGCNGAWRGAWVLLSRRRFWYACEDSHSSNVDLRKACYVGMQESDATSPKTADDGPVLVVGTPSCSVYVRAWTVRETKTWGSKVAKSAHTNGKSLEEQQLTRDNVPVLVEKCINFIYAHGSTSEGIYRRNGVSQVVKGTLEAFRRNAWAVVLRHGDGLTEHDAANVLKRFVRDLPEPLFGASNKEYLCRVVAEVVDKQERIGRYRSLFEDLTPIARNTIRKIFGHLHFIQSQSEQNLMNSENLASVWAPTMMHSDPADEHESHRWLVEVTAIKDLLVSYRDVFPAERDELERERLMLRALERAKAGPSTRAGDLRVWVQVAGRPEPCAISLSPRRTAEDVCRELADKLPGQSTKPVRLAEQILGGSLVRWLLPDELPLDSVLSWSGWDESDRKDNCLLVDRRADLPDLPAEFREEVRYADERTRAPPRATVTWSVLGGQVAYSRERSGAKVCEWPARDLVWYEGGEAKRLQATGGGHPMTFVLRRRPRARTRSAPWFGHLVLLESEAARRRLLAALNRAATAATSK